jgi:hypothetical protein
MNTLYVQIHVITTTPGSEGRARVLRKLLLGKGILILRGLGGERKI